MNPTARRKVFRSGWILAATWCGLLISTQADAAPCNAGVCKADVTVQSCESGTMSVDPEPITVPAPNNIEWTIATPGYSFPQDGIVINGSGFAPRPGVNGNGRKFTVHDDHTDKRPDIKYTVRVVRDADGVTCAPYDPRIRNL